MKFFLLVVLFGIIIGYGIYAELPLMFIAGSVGLLAVCTNLFIDDTAINYVSFFIFIGSLGYSAWVFYEHYFGSVLT